MIEPFILQIPRDFEGSAGERVGSQLALPSSMLLDKTIASRPTRTSISIKALGLAALLTFPVLAACSDEEPAANPNECRQASGPSTIAAECKSGGADRTRAAETFRTHVALSSSAVGIARRQADGAMTWFATCIADAIGQTILLAFTGAPPGDLKCGQWDQSSAYAFAKGEYVFDLRQRISFLGTSVADSENSATLRFVFTKAIAGQAEGAVVPFDLGRADTYLVGARLVTDGAKTGIAYERPGPLVELLGFGATPPNPILLSESSARKMEETMRSTLAIEGSTKANLGDCGQRSVIELAIDRTAMNADVHPRLLSAITTADGKTEPLVVAKTWDVTYAAGNPDAPSGQVQAELPADTLASRVTVRFAGSDPAAVELEVACSPR